MFTTRAGRIRKFHNVIILHTLLALYVYLSGHWLLPCPGYHGSLNMDP